MPAAVAREIVRRPASDFALPSVLVKQKAGRKINCPIYDEVTPEIKWQGCLFSP